MRFLVVIIYGVRMSFIKTLTAVNFIFLTGCASQIPLIQTINPNSIPADKGFLMFSIGAEKPCKLGTTNLNLKKYSSPMGIFSITGSFPMNNGYVKSDLPKDSPYVKFHTVLVDAGSYDFWISSAAAPYYEYSHPLFSKPFKVKAGETIYLGETYVVGCSGSISLEVRDSFDRDMSYFQNLNSNLNLDKVTRRPLEKINY